MGLMDGLKKAVSIGVGQLTQPGSKPIKEVHFTNNFQVITKARGMTEKDALDVFHHGTEVKQNMLVRKYNGDEIGIYTFTDKLTGQPFISSIWKRARR